MSTRYFVMYVCRLLVLPVTKLTTSVIKMEMAIMLLKSVINTSSLHKTTTKFYFCVIYLSYLFIYLYGY